MAYQYHNKRGGTPHHKGKGAQAQQEEKKKPDLSMIYAQKRAQDFWLKSLSIPERARTLAASYYAYSNAEATGTNYEKSAPAKKSLEQVRDGASVQEFIHHWGTFLASLPHAASFQGTLQSRLAINMGGSVLENAGMALEHVCGIPVIPGSAVKGSARHYAIYLLQNAASFAAKDQLLEDIMAVFGYTPDDLAKGSDLCYAMNCETLPAPGGVKATKGSICFLQAVPSENPKLCLDILTPHHQEYMAGKKDAPEDTESPIPCLFPAVEKGAVYTFSLCWCGNTEPDVRLLRLAQEWLVHGLELFGLGAKTAAGYGQFATDDQPPAPGAKPKCILQQDLMFMTPCYCAGAEQSKAELRVPSIRGELRWWLRCISVPGYDAWCEQNDQERKLCLQTIREREWRLFGGPIKNGSKASAVSVRTAILPGKADTVQRFIPSRYIDFALTGRNALPAGTLFRVAIHQHRPISPEDMEALKLAWHCMCLFGSLGYRKNRGYGAIAPAHYHFRGLPGQEEILDTLYDLGFCDCSYDLPKSDMAACIKKIGDMLENKRRPNKGKDKKNRIRSDVPTPLGSGEPRQGSAIRFRPVQTNGTFKLLVLRAPNIVLGQAALSNDSENMDPQEF